MKVPATILARYRAAHSWLGIMTGSLLFVAFFAGAISVFEQPLRILTSPAVTLPAPLPLKETPRLIEAALQKYPEIRGRYTIIIQPGSAQSARMMWSAHAASAHMRQDGPVIFAALTADGKLMTQQQKEAPIASFIEKLHETFGLPLPRRLSGYVMGIISLLYVVALVSGVVIFLPAMMRNLFAVRLGQHARKAWRDVHNVLGIFSLPFHLIMGITAVAFAFHGPIYSVEKSFFPPAVHSGVSHNTHKNASSDMPIPGAVLTPIDVVKIMEAKAPGFVVTSLLYSQHGRNAPTIRVIGEDVRYAMRGLDFGFAEIDARTGALISTSYLPGHQSLGFMILTFFFASHFGSFGGIITKICYLILGFAGAFLFYTGNHLWIIAQRRKEQTNGAVCDGLTLHIVSRLTCGWIYGSMGGIGLLILAGITFPDRISLQIAYYIYYISLVLSIVVTLFIRRTHYLSVS